MIKMLPTEDRGHIPAMYGEFVEVCPKDKAETLLPHWSTNHAIDLQPSYTLPYGRIDHLLEFELRMLTAYIKANLANSFIQRSLSPAAAPILLAKKKHAGLRLCVDFCGLNLATVKNRYPLAFLAEMLNAVH
jgi:hypothetical protein